MPPPNTFQRIAIELSCALSPLQDITSNLDEFANFLLTELGWNINGIPKPVKDLFPQIHSLVNLIQDISDKDEISYSKLAEITSTSIKLIHDIRKIDKDPNANAGLLKPLVEAGFMQKLSDELLQYLFVEYLRQYHPKVYAGLKSLGIISLELEEPITTARTPYIKRTVNWSYFSDILARPQKLFEEVYGRAGSDLDSLLIIIQLAKFFETLGFGLLLEQMDNGIAEILEKKTEAESEIIKKTEVESELIKTYVKLPFIANDGIANASFEWGLFPLPKDNERKSGFAILFFNNSPEKTIDNISPIFKTRFKNSQSIGIIVRPNDEIKVFGFDKKGSLIATEFGSFKAGLIFKGNPNPNEKTRLLSASDGLFLETCSQISFNGVELSISNHKELFLEFHLDDCRLVISSHGLDGFLSSILPEDGININFDLIVGISTLKGIYLGGSSGLEIAIPIHKSIGPVEIGDITLAIKHSNGVIPIKIGSTIKGELGPVQVLVENLGLNTSLSFSSDFSGNLGPMDLSLAFMPPNDIGLSIDAGIIKGGGYLDFDPKKEEYSGTLELVVSGWLNLKGFGLINTRLPGGQPGFSMLVIITADFGETGYQLGYGFTLLKVGGLLGLNRTLKIEALAEGIRANSITSLMFPKDVVANAPRIISDLRAIFPPQEDTFLIAPMAEIGWGTPTLIRVSLGVIIELPSSNIAIVGVLKVALPSEQTPLLAINVGFLGVIQPSKSRLWFFARLFDSNLLGMTLEGEAGLLMAWGENANFVFSVGGFHPSFTPPPLPFPVPERITLSILDHDNARIRISGYFAVTSNTVQFGAKAELYFGFTGFNVSGHMAFDALLQLSPFYFMVQVSCHLSLTVFGIGLFGIGLDLSLEGPTPWHVQGNASLRILFFTIRVPIDITWGESHETSLEDIKIMQLVIEEFKKPQNWTAELPDSYNLLVTMREIDEAPGVIILHPLGALRVSQRLVPLDVQLDKMGNKKISDYRKLTVESSDGFKKSGDTKEMFAMAQFQERSDADKLSLPSYQKCNAGLLMSDKDQELSSSHMVRRKIRYETVIIDNNYKRSEPTLVGIYKGLFTHSLNSNAVTKSALSKAHKRQLDPFEEKEKVKLKPESYTVVLAGTNQAYPEATAQAIEFESESLAREYMQKQIRKDPNRADLLQVIPTSEVCRIS